MPGQAGGQIKVTCSDESFVSSPAEVTLYQRPNTSVGFTKVKEISISPDNSPTPYYSGFYYTGCKSGYQVHFYGSANVTTPDGGGTEQNNSDNGTCP
jgi:hypothetical protein